MLKNILREILSIIGWGLLTVISQRLCCGLSKQHRVIDANDADFKDNSRLKNALKYFCEIHGCLAEDA